MFKITFRYFNHGNFQQGPSQLANGGHFDLSMQRLKYSGYYGNLVITHYIRKKIGNVIACSMSTQQGLFLIPHVQRELVRG